MTAIASATLIGTAPLFQSRFHNEPKKPKELADDYEKRTFMERLHTMKTEGLSDDDSQVVLTALALKGMMFNIAKYLSIQVPGKGKATYTKHFRSGVQVSKHPFIQYNGKILTKDEVQARAMHVPSDGVAGGGKRVIKYYPCIPSGWSVDVDFHITDETITETVFLQHLKQAGILIGLGAFRVENRGINGIFDVGDFKWTEYTI